MKDFQFSIALGVVQCREDVINAELLENLIHQLVLKNSMPLSDQMYLGTGVLVGSG